MSKKAVSTTHYVEGAHQNALELGGGADSDWLDGYRRALAEALVKFGTRSSLKSVERNDISYVDADTLHEATTDISDTFDEKISETYVVAAVACSAAPKAKAYVWKFRGTTSDLLARIL